jgi:hypothetical protein
MRNKPPVSLSRTPPLFIENPLPYPVGYPAGRPAPLPASVRDLVDVLGRERTLFFIGQLPVCFVKKPSRYGPKSRATSKGEKRVILYVPKRLKPDHRLVKILGWNDAQRLVDVFGGEILCPPTMHEVVYRPFRDAAMIRLAIAQQVPVSVLAEWFDMGEQRVRQVLDSAVGEIPQEALRAANTNNRATETEGA